MNASDVLLLTSLHEGSPNVVKEALACNLPVVSVPVGDIPERIGRVPGCVVCKDALADTIVIGLASVLERGESFNGRVLAENQFDERVQVQQVINIYRHRMQSRQREGSLTSPSAAANAPIGAGDLAVAARQSVAVPHLALNCVHAITIANTALTTAPNGASQTARATATTPATSSTDKIEARTA
jgi:hypothetical protein